MTYVWLELDGIDSEDMIQELESRGYKVEEKELTKQLFQVMKSYQCDSQETFDRNMQIFIDRWYTEI